MPVMPFAGDDHSPTAGGGDGSDEATDSEDLGLVGRNFRRASDSGGAEESRRMFQKLWTDADEIKVLQGFYEFTSRRGTTHANYQHDTGPFFDDIRPRLQFEFNKNQIVEKLRRLKKKYRNAAARIGSGRGSVFKNPHDRATYEISRKIWSSTFKRKPKNHPHSDAAPILPDRPGGVSGGSKEALVPVAIVESSARASQGIPILASSVPAQLPPPSPQLPLPEKQPSPPPQEPSPPPQPQVRDPKAGRSVEEEALRICLAPLFKELVQFALDGATAAGAVTPPLWVLPSLASVATKGEEDERWRRQRILELELYLKRVELVEDIVRSALEKLRSTGN